MFIPNPDIEERNRILNRKDMPHTTANIDNISRETIEALIEKGFLDIKSTHNYSPEVSQFLSFMQQHDNTYAHGYVISDGFMSITGIEAKEASLRTTVDFLNLCHNADEIKGQINYSELTANLYAWWD